MPFKNATHYKSGSDYIAALVEEIQEKHNCSLRYIAKEIGIGFSTLRDLKDGRSNHNYPTQYILEALRDSPPHQETSMKTLFDILDSIISANSFGHEDTIATLNSIDDIVSHAEAMDLEIDDDQALQIQQVGLDWIQQVEDGGEWSLYRDEAKKRLDEEL